jgi:hypothetical protein
MLGLQIGTEFLDLASGATLEMQRSNPMLQFNEAIPGEFSLPLDAPLTPKNQRLLAYAGLIQASPGTAGVDVNAYDNGIQHSSGKLKVEKVNHNLDRSEAGTISLYYLTGLSAFNQDAKGKKLKDLNYGGQRSFSWDSLSRSGAGFWGHIHRVIDAPAGYGSSGYDYAFYPVINHGWEGDVTIVDMMNSLFYENGQVNFHRRAVGRVEGNPIVPFPYLKYVLIQALLSIGWRIEGDILSDPQFCQITLLNFKSIAWGLPYIKEVILGETADGVPVNFDLRDHMPDTTLPEFLIALKNRFGWKYDYDSLKKTIKITQFKSLIGSTYKDLTRYASPLVPKTVLPEKTIYSLKNDFTGEYASAGSDVPAGQRKEDLFLRSLLPPASEANYGHMHLIVQENNFYVCRLNEDGSFIWDLYRPNIFDVVPEGATQEIPTKAVTVGMEAYDAYLTLVPRMDNAGYYTENTEEITWGINLLFYYGLQPNYSGQVYPFASNTIYGPAENQVGLWSLAFETNDRLGNPIGLYQLNWKPLLDFINAGEEMEVTLYLPKIEYLDLKFTDVLIIAHVRLFIKETKHSIPYGDKIVLQCSRI